MRGCGKASLATTLADGGGPYASLVTVAFDHDGSPILLLSGLADHTRNIAADPRAALLFDGTADFANPQEGPRFTAIGLLERCDHERLRHRFLARHPLAALYAGFGDFAVYRFEVRRGHLVGGFARAVWIADGLLAEPTAARRIGTEEADLIAGLNAADGETLDLIARRLLMREGRGWRMTGIDPEGCDLVCGDAYARLDFDRPVEDADGVRRAIRVLGETARGVLDRPRTA